MSAVKIALRVRPPSEREKQEDQPHHTIVDVESEQNVSITNLKIPSSNAGDSRARVKRFTFDFCFDSTSPENENYATQEKVFDKVGSFVLKSLFEGRDSCVLAYGQSASGKTFTMQGTKNQPGIIPRLCEAFFNSETIRATLSYFEIYNERVRDLLAADDREVSSVNQHRRDLRVREHPKKGPYVEDLSNIEVESGKELVSLWWSAAKRRRTASTATNAHSSRSHALLTIKRNLPHPPVTLTLLDLAGSERPSRVNQSEPRQKEGANINKSLVALANVISALVSAGPRGGCYVPYRDSVLTWLLKDTLSSGATTIMIATVSPSSSCYTETVNTMRWAARAARIPPGTSRSSDTPHERAIRQLRAEVARLRALLATVTASSKIKPKEDLTMANSKNAPQEVSEVSEVTLKHGNENSFQERLNEGEDSLDSLGSSRISLASMDTLSGNNSNPSTQGSNLNSSQTEDNLFGPRLHRAGSVHDVKPPVPLRSKRRQYSSHEGLNADDKQNKNTTKVNSTNKILNNKGNVSEKSKETQKQRVTVTYQPFNKRAEIVASVTDRLYSKLKKSDEDKSSKIIGSTVEKKNNQTLTELEICSNARKKLYDLSHKALKASRRYKVAPAETQTEKPSTLLYKDAATDVPKDTELYVKNCFIEDKILKSVATTTETHTTICKEAAVGRVDGSIHSNDVCIETDQIKDTPKIILTRTCGNMTEELQNFNDCSTQTQENQPKKKRSSFTKYLKVSHNTSTPIKMKDKVSPTVLNINISHDCSQFGNGNDCISDDSLEMETKPCKTNAPIVPPDLINNHNSNENDSNATYKESSIEKNCPDKIPTFNIQQPLNEPVKNEDFMMNTTLDLPVHHSDFIDDLHIPLPRVYFNPEYPSNHWSAMKNIIMGRNENSYPYNIKISPIKEPTIKRKYSKSVSFQKDDEKIKSTSSKPKQSIIKKTVNYSSDSEVVDSDDFNSISDSDSNGTKFFKGIYCWGEKSPVAPRRKKTKYKRNAMYKNNMNECVQYVKATSNFLTEATNLVSVLAKATDRVSQNQVSPNCNNVLHTEDETCIRKQLTVEDLTASIENIVRSMNCSRMINDPLVNNDERYKTVLSDDEFNNCDTLNDMEKDLMASLDSLEKCRKKSNEYFSTVADRYMEKFNRSLPTVKIEDYKPDKSQRINPSAYLKQLLEIRRELVESTKRDEDIYQSFRV